MKDKDRAMAALADIISDIALMPKGKEQETWAHIATYLDSCLVPRLWALAEMVEDNKETIQNAESGGLT